MSPESGYRFRDKRHALGSLWALVPAALVGLALVVRTELEDKTLANELQGYRDYQRRVRHKLIPNVW